jgi:hypothetical protein
MSEQAHVLARLARLRPEDRAWLVRNLSSQQRQALMELAESEPAAVEREAEDTLRQSEARDAIEPCLSAAIALRAASAMDVGEVLAHEPAWLIRAVMSLEEWPWNEQLLQLLPAKMRVEVLQLPRCSLPIPVRESLILQCAQHLPASRVAAPTPTSQSILGRIGTMFVRRRLALRQ